jgi:uncharacterized Zn finger protein
MTITKKNEPDLLTPEQKKWYLENSCHCPFCEGDQTEGGHIEVNEDDKAIQECHCHDCGSVWKDIYTLTNVVGVEVG